MTDAQKQQFDKFGCVSRCIIKLTEWHQKPITADDFVARFYGRYPHWVEVCGLLSMSDIIDICRELQIARHANTYRDIAVVRGFLHGVMTSGVFMFSERDFTGVGEKIYHCSLVGYTNQRFRVWSPTADGRFVEGELEDSAVYEMTDKGLAHFLVLRCNR
jgi:hypothetical protein